MPSKGVSPKWPTNDAIRVGRGALVLANEDRPVVEPRLDAGTIDGLSADLDLLEGKKSESSRAVTMLKEASRTEDAIAAEATVFVIAGREAVARGRATKAEREAFGLSQKVNPASTPTVIRALDAFISGAAKYPAVARAASTLPEDIDRMRALRASLSAADAEQESTKVARKLPVGERKEVQLRVEAAVGAIVSAGVIAFAAQPAKSEKYRALIPAKKRRATKPVA